MKITREVAKELLPILKAFAEGKAIQDKIEGLTGWVDTEEINLEFEGQKILHRIKPELKYRPFKNQKECWMEMLKHKPFGWIKNNDTKRLRNINSIDNCSIDINGSILHFDSAFNVYKFVDDTPFGIKED